MAAQPYLVHVRAPSITAEHADYLADDLYPTGAELEPDEAVTMYFFAVGDEWSNSHVLAQPGAH